MMEDKTGLLVAHDYFAIRGGGEKLCLTLAEGLNATLMFGYQTEDSYDLTGFPGKLIDLKLNKQFRKPMLRVPALSMRFAAASGVVKPYKTRIYSGITSVFAAPLRSSECKNIYYCHTPPRFLFDQREYFDDQRGRGFSALKSTALSIYKERYLRAMERMDVIVANSANIQSRIVKYLGRDSSIVYPPVDLSKFRWLSEGDYYVSTARLAPLKRVKEIVEAFRQMPEKKLIVASGGEELPRLQQLASGCHNIVFTDWISDEDMRELIGRCIATIYVPIDEDFGMSPVESMAAGKPVIGVNEGGLKETIVHGQTGILLPPDFGPEQIREAVKELSSGYALRMRDACEKRASLFSKDRFLDAIGSLVG